MAKDSDYLDLAKQPLEAVAQAYMHQEFERTLALPPEDPDYASKVAVHARGAYAVRMFVEHVKTQADSIREARRKHA